MRQLEACLQFGCRVHLHPSILPTPSKGLVLTECTMRVCAYLINYVISGVLGCQDKHPVEHICGLLDELLPPPMIVVLPRQARHLRGCECVMCVVWRELPPGSHCNTDTEGSTSTETNLHLVHDQVGAENGVPLLRVLSAVFLCPCGFPGCW